jgi:nucleotide-binding universal stress UspA family protein
MEQPPFQSIVHPTDFSSANEPAFAHALRLAVAARSALHILHIEQDGEETEWDRFPRVRKLLTQWGMLEAGAPESAVESRLGVRLIKAAVESDDVVEAVGAYAERHLADLLVMMTHESSWMRRLLEGSLAEAAARLTHAPALFLKEGQHGFVDLNTGKVRLNRVMMPVAADISPMHAWGIASDAVRALEPMAQFQLIHVGDTLPTFGNLLPHVELREGPVVETILAFANEIGPDLIVMATEGHHSLFDDLRGNTTEQVVREAPCPVLAIPVR